MLNTNFPQQLQVSLFPGVISCLWHLGSVMYTLAFVLLCALALGPFICFVIGFSPWCWYQFQFCDFWIYELLPDSTLFYPLCQISLCHNVVKTYHDACHGSVEFHVVAHHNAVKIYCVVHHVTGDFHLVACPITLLSKTIMYHSTLPITFFCTLLSTFVVDYTPHYFVAWHIAKIYFYMCVPLPF